MLIDGFRSENSRFTAETMVVAIIPMTHALIGHSVSNPVDQCRSITSNAVALTYSNSVGRHILIVVADGSAHFEVWGVLLEQGMLEVGLLLDIIGLCNSVGGILLEMSGTDYSQENEILTR